MTRLWTIVGVRDVPASCRWYQSLLGYPAAAPVHDYFGQIVDADGLRLARIEVGGAGRRIRGRGRGLGGGCRRQD